MAQALRSSRQDKTSKDAKRISIWQNAKELKMALSVNTNMGAMVALQNLSKTNDALANTQNRISTGLKVGSVRDESSTWQIAQNIRGDLSGLNGVKTSLDRAKSTLDLTITAAESISDLLLQAREKATAVADLGIDVATRDALNNDFRAVMTQIDSQIQSSEFNGTNLLKGNPDAIGAIVSVNADSSTDRISVNGLDLRTSGNTARYLNTNAAVAVNQNDSLGQLLTRRGAPGSVAAGNGGAPQVAGLISSTFTTVAGNGLIEENTGNITLQGGSTAYTSATGLVSVTLGGVAFTAQAQAGLSGTQQFTIKLDQLRATTTASMAVTPQTAATSRTAFDLNFNAGDGATAAQKTQAFSDRMSALATVDTYAQRIKNQLSTWGSSSRQLDLQRTYVTKLQDSWESGVGNLVDADLAAESAKLQGLQVRQQLGTQALSLANQAPQALLSLFR
jgi:flagellin